MNALFWVLQGILAGLFLITGSMKLLQKKEAVADKLGYVEDFTQKQLYGIGILEILGAFGVILPRLTGILPWLTRVAAGGLALVMVGAFFTHLRRDEFVPHGIINIVIFGLAVLIIISRV
jgi:uncharacterized membrane protein YphA (DoxX/SURF4 family)